MVDSAGIFYSKTTGHNGHTVASIKANVNSKDLTLKVLKVLLRSNIKQRRSP